MNSLPQESFENDLRRYTGLFIKWSWLIVISILIASGIAYFVSSRMPPIYRATTVLLIGGNSNEVASDYRSILAAENLVPTYAEQLTGRRVRNDVMEVLGLETWTANLNTSPIRDTQLLTLNVEHTDPKLAMQIANLIPVVFIKWDAEIQQERLQSAEETISQQLAVVQADIDSISEDIFEIENSDNPDQAVLDQLYNQLYEYQASHAAFTHSYQEIRLAQVKMFDPILISEPAELPQTPVGPKIWQNTLLAAVVGGMLAVGIVTLIDFMDNTIKSPEDIQRVTGFGTLCTIPLDRSNPTEIISASEPRSPVAEAYRVLRTNIQLRTIDTPLQTILVTSSIPFEGKSTLAANLGVVMAQAGLSTIVVDADLRRPSLHSQFNIQNQSQGLTKALLADDIAIVDQLQETQTENLSVLASGPLPPNPSELLGSERMKGLIETLKQQAGIIIFDSPPLLGMADASVLAKSVEGVLLVVGAGEVRNKSVAQAIHSLTEIDTNLLGLVLTKLDPGQADNYYYYYQGNKPKGRKKKNRG